MESYYNIETADLIDEMFHRETGYYAPGKDIGAAVGHNPETEMEKRIEVWEKWLAGFEIRALESQLELLRSCANPDKMPELLSWLKALADEAPEYNPYTNPDSADADEMVHIIAKKIDELLHAIGYKEEE